MAKDSIEQIQANSAEAEPVVEIVTEQNNENNIDAKTDPIENTEISETAGTAETAKKVRKTTQGNKGRKSSTNGEATKTATGRTRKKSSAVKDTAIPAISSKESTKESLTTQDVEDPIVANDREEVPADKDTQSIKNNEIDETPAKIIDTDAIPDSTLQEPTIIAEPIGAGATVDVVTADNTTHAVEQPQELLPHILIDDSMRQEEVTDNIVNETAEEHQLAEETAITDAENAENQRSRDRRELMRSASLVSIGNFGSSVLGMLRQVFIASTGAAVSGPFYAALAPAQKFNAFIINGSVPGALIPTFNDYAAPEKREELRRLMFTLVNLVILVMAGASIIFFFVAPWVTTHVLAIKLTPDEQALTTHYSQIIFLSLLALGPFAVLQAGLFARKEFGWPAFATGAYHAGIIVGAGLTAVVGTHFIGSKYGIAFGVLLGAVGEIGLLIPGFAIRN